MPYSLYACLTQRAQTVSKDLSGHVQFPFFCAFCKVIIKPSLLWCHKITYCVPLWFFYTSHACANRCLVKPKTSVCLKLFGSLSNFLIALGVAWAV